MIRFLDIENSIWIYDSNGTPKINLVPVSFCGIIAAKLIANRNKDFVALTKIFRDKNIRTESDLERLFYNFPSFIETDKYQVLLETAKEIFKELGDY